MTQQIHNGDDPAAGGLLYNIAQGLTSPFDVFGTGTIDAAAKAYAFGFLQEDLGVRQNVFAFNATGDLFEGFKRPGTIKGAAGVEYRKESGTNIGSQAGKPEYVRTDYLIQYGESFAGDVDVVEGYVEGRTSRCAVPGRPRPSGRSGPGRRRGGPGDRRPAGGPRTRCPDRRRRPWSTGRRSGRPGPGPKPDRASWRAAIMP